MLHVTIYHLQGKDELPFLIHFYFCDVSVTFWHCTRLKEIGCAWGLTGIQVPRVDMISISHAVYIPLLLHLYFCSSHIKNPGDVPGYQKRSQFSVWINVTFQNNLNSQNKSVATGGKHSKLAYTYPVNNIFSIVGQDMLVQSWHVLLSTWPRLWMMADSGIYKAKSHDHFLSKCIWRSFEGAMESHSLS